MLMICRKYAFVEQAKKLTSYDKSVKHSLVFDLLEVKMLQNISIGATTKFHAFSLGYWCVGQGKITE